MNTKVYPAKGNTTIDFMALGLTQTAKLREELASFKSLYWVRDGLEGEYFFCVALSMDMQGHGKGSTFEEAYIDCLGRVGQV